MNPEEKAEVVAKIAKEVGYRKRHQIGHTGHTVRRLLEAVSDLLGAEVQVVRAPQLGQHVDG